MTLAKLVGYSWSQSHHQDTEDNADNSAEEYEVEAIIDCRLQPSTGKMEYLIKWKDYGPVWNSWEPEEHLNCPQLLQKFLHTRGKSSAKASDSNVGDLYKSLAGSHDTISAIPAKRNSQLEALDTPKRATVTTSTTVNISQNPLRKLQAAVDDFARMMNSCGGALVTVENGKSLIPPPAHFKCISSPIFRPGVPAPDSNFIIGCDCGPNGCHSLAKDSDCLCLNQNNDSKRVYDASGRLMIESGPIYECNFKCPCPKTCPNRVVQRGRTVKLKIVYFNDTKGWGVLAGQDIPKGTFIDVYLGEIITSSEGSARVDKGQGDYLFDLDFNYEVGAESDFTIDAYNYGNVTHFFNHSCEPNLKVHPCFIDSWDPRLHYLAFFARKNIALGEELCFDYLGGQKKPQAVQSRRSTSPRAKCQCGTRSCRGYIY